jgi:L-alanine-DL-glutamate epimerase-like enolase superfamily enzyme
MPVYDLLGGKLRPALPMFGGVNGRDLSELENNARRAIEAGYKYLRVGAVGGDGSGDAPGQGATGGAAGSGPGLGRGVSALQRTWTDLPATRSGLRLRWWPAGRLTSCACVSRPAAV